MALWHVQSVARSGCNELAYTGIILGYWMGEDLRQTICKYVALLEQIGKNVLSRDRSP